MTLQLGILLALGCALATNLGFLYKHRGACAAPAVDGRHPLRSATGLFRSKWFAMGMAVALGAWVLHVGALALAPISVVQTVLAGGVALLAVMAERLFGLQVGMRQWIGVALTGAGLAMLAITLPHTGGAHATFSVPAMIAFEAGFLTVGAMLVIGPRVARAPARDRGVMLGAAAGILFGVSDVAIKALTGLAIDGGVLGLLSPWLGVAVVASIVAFFASARGLQLGQAVPVITFTGMAANVSTILGGVIVFGDPMPGDPVGIAVQVLAFTMVVAAAVLTPAPVRATHATAS